MNGQPVSRPDFHRRAVAGKQRIATAEGDDADVFGYHFENGMLAVNLFHMRGGQNGRPPGIFLGRPAGFDCRIATRKSGQPPSAQTSKAQPISRSEANESNSDQAVVRRSAELIFRGEFFPRC